MRMEAHAESPHCFAVGKKIVVAGAGIAGLAFAAALRKQWASLPASLTPPEIILYERDPKDYGAERDGYSISIRSDGNAAGLQALQKLGLLDIILPQSITGYEETGTFCLWDREWKEILRAKAAVPNNLPVRGMRIKRNVLRKVLIEAVNANDKIHWATTCTGAVKLSNGKIGVQLSNGDLDECDLLVAADGSGSKIRSAFRPEDKLSFNGAINIAGISKFEDGIPPPVDRNWGIYLAGTGASLFVSPIDKYDAIWSLGYLAPTSREIPKSPSAEWGEELRKEALERGSGFAEPFQTLVRATDATSISVLNNRDKQPFPHLTGSIEDIPIVFIGDSNHAVSPYAGSGANLALLDGWELAQQLCQKESLSSALTTYDVLAMPRAKSAVKFSHWSIDLAHSGGWRLKVYIWLARIVAWLFLR